MREDWKKVKLDEISEFSQGTQVPVKDQEFEKKDGYGRFIRIVDYTQGSDDIRYIKEPGSKYYVNKDDIVMVRYGSPGLIGRGIEGFIANNLFQIKPTTSEISKDYLSAYLRQDNIQNYLSTQGSVTMPALTFGRLKKVEISFPKLSEQKRIVAILDEAFETIDKAMANIERNIANAEELFQSKLNEIFSQRGEGWEEKRLDEVCENLDRMREPISKKNREEGPYPYYGASGIVDYVADYIFDEDLLLVSEDGANLLARTYPIAFSISGKNWVNNHAHVLRFENMASQRFIEYYLNSIKLDPWVSGMAQPKLNQRNLNSIPVPFPPLEDQKKIVSGLDVLKNDIESITEAYKNKIYGLEELKKSILQKAFSGELTANEDVAA